MQSQQRRSDIGRTSRKGFLTLGAVFDYRNQCYNKARQRWKIKYDSKAEAKQAAKQMASLPEYTILKAYRCPHCGFFHLGNPVEGAANIGPERITSETYS
jgi:rubrerythrin